MSTRTRHAPRGRIKARHPLTAEHSLSQKCHAKSKRTGKQCGAWAIPGGAVCKWHGGAAPQVKAAAEQRIEALKQPAIAYLGYLLDQRDYPSAGLGAAKDVLDRIDGRAAETIRMQVDTVDAQLKRLDEGRARVAQAKRLTSGKG